MAYTSNYLSGKNGAVFVYDASGSINALGVYTGGAGTIPIGGYSTTWAFGKWKIDIETNLPKVTNFTSVAAFNYPAGVVSTAAVTTTTTTIPAGTGQFFGAFQQLVNGVTKATLTVDGPADVGNMPVVSGYTYVFKLVYSASVSLFVPAMINKISPVVDIEDAERVQVTAESTGYFLPVII